MCLMFLLIAEKISFFVICFIFVCLFSRVVVCYCIIYIEVKVVFLSAFTNNSRALIFSSLQELGAPELHGTVRSSLARSSNCIYL